jgi:hypothetical protein
MLQRPWMFLLALAASLFAGPIPAARAGVPKVVFGEDFTATG